MEALYDDLDVIQYQNLGSNERIKSLECQLLAKQTDIDNLQTQLSDKEKKLSNALKNMHLFKETIQGALKSKDQEIYDLRRKLNNITFRREQNANVFNSNNKRVWHQQELDNDKLKRLRTPELKDDASNDVDSNVDDQHKVHVNGGNLTLFTKRMTQKYFPETINSNKIEVVNDDDEKCKDNESAEKCQPRKSMSTESVSYKRKRDEDKSDCQNNFTYKEKKRANVRQSDSKEMENGKKSTCKKNDRNEKKDYEIDSGKNSRTDSHSTSKRRKDCDSHINGAENDLRGRSNSRHYKRSSKSIDRNRKENYRSRDKRYERFHCERKKSNSYREDPKKRSSHKSDRDKPNDRKHSTKDKCDEELENLENIKQLLLETLMNDDEKNKCERGNSENDRINNENSREKNHQIKVNGESTTKHSKNNQKIKIENPPGTTTLNKMDNIQQKSVQQVEEIKKELISQKETVNNNEILKNQSQTVETINELSIEQLNTQLEQLNKSVEILTCKNNLQNMPDNVTHDVITQKIPHIDDIDVETVENSMKTIQETSTKPYLLKKIDINKICESKWREKLTQSDKQEPSKEQLKLSKDLLETPKSVEHSDRVQILKVEVYDSTKIVNCSKLPNPNNCEILQSNQLKHKPITQFEDAQINHENQLEGHQLHSKQIDSKANQSNPVVQIDVNQIADQQIPELNHLKFKQIVAQSTPIKNPIRDVTQMSIKIDLKMDLSRQTSFINDFDLSDDDDIDKTIEFKTPIKLKGGASGDLKTPKITPKPQTITPRRSARKKPSNTALQMIPIKSPKKLKVITGQQQISLPEKNIIAKAMDESINILNNAEDSITESILDQAIYSAKCAKTDNTGNVLVSSSSDDDNDATLNASNNNHVQQQTQSKRENSTNSMSTKSHSSMSNMLSSSSSIEATKDIDQYNMFSKHKTKHMMIPLTPRVKNTSINLPSANHQEYDIPNKDYTVSLDHDSIPITPGGDLDVEKSVTKTIASCQVYDEPMLSTYSRQENQLQPNLIVKNDSQKPASKLKSTSASFHPSFRSRGKDMRVIKRFSKDFRASLGKFVGDDDDDDSDGVLSWSLSPEKCTNLSLHSDDDSKKEEELLSTDIVNDDERNEDGSETANQTCVQSCENKSDETKFEIKEEFDDVEVVSNVSVLSSNKSSQSNVSITVHSSDSDDASYDLVQSNKRSVYMAKKKIGQHKYVLRVKRRF